MRRRLRHDTGATAVEYALIMALIALVVITAVVFLGSSVLGLFDTSASSVSDATNA